MNAWLRFFFVIYPYICVTIMVLGLVFRYVATPGEWNARSSELFGQRALSIGSFLFHYAIILSFFGHIFGLLTPEWLMNSIGFSTGLHMKVAGIAGQILAPCVIAGLGILLWRRLANPEVRATTAPMDLMVMLFIMINAVTGMYQSWISHFGVFSTIGPWLRSLVVFNPNPEYMTFVPLFLKIHVLSGFTLFALIPFSRLVHFFSIPLTYLARPFILYRSRYGNL